MKRLTQEIRYDGATPERVWAMQQQPEFRDAVSEYQRYTRRDITITPSGAGMSVRIDQYRPATEAPAFAKKFVGDEINVLHEEEWSSPTSGRLNVTIPGKPGSMTATVRVTSDDAGVTLLVEGEVTAKIPLIGGKIEDFISGMFARALRAENKVGIKWLAEGKA